MAAEVLGLSGISALTGLKGGRGVWKISLFSGQEQWKGSCGDKAEISALDLKRILHELMRGKAAEKGRMIPFIPLLHWVQLCHRQKLYSSLVREMQEYIDVMQWFIREDSDLTRFEMTWYTWLITAQIDRVKLIQETFPLSDEVQSRLFCFLNSFSHRDKELRWSWIHS